MACVSNPCHNNEMIDALAIICSRKDSSRLPGKAFKRIAGRTAIEHIVKRLSPVFKTVVAVPKSDMPDYIALLSGKGADIVSGNADSPLHRLYDVARQYNNPKWIIRVTHDDIIIDTQTITDLIAQCEFENSGYGCTPGIVEGAGVEVIRFENLEYAARNRVEATEFVSYFVKGDGLPFPDITKMNPRNSIQRDYRLTMDYPEDAKALEVVLRATGPDASVDSICYHLDHRPYILNINRLPEFSVYTCTHNAESYIQQTILSVLNSDITKMEYVIVDDCSTDGTLDHIAKHFNDSRVRVVLNESNKGLASSSNIALSACRGKYVMRVDADDVLLPHNFSENLWTIKNKINDGASVVYPAYYEMDEIGNRIGDVVDPRINNHAGCAVMSKAIVNEFRFRDGLRHWDGLELFKRIGGKAEYFNYPTWLYRKHNKSMSANNLQERASIKGTMGLGHLEIKK